MARLDEHKGEDWGEMAKIYKQLTVGVNNRPIEAILTRLDAIWPFSEAHDILDNGTGPGPILARIIQDYGSVIPPSSKIVATDFSPPMIDQVINTKNEALAKDATSPWSRVSTAVLDAMNLQGVPDESKSHVTAGWVFFMTPDPQKCLAESRRVLKDRGVLGCSSWKGSQWLDIMHLVAEVRPDKQLPALPKEWADQSLLKHELEKGGFRDVESIEVPVELSFDDYEPFLDLMTDKMPHMIALLKDFTPEEKQKLRDLMMKKTKEYAPSAPGTLHGTALVAVGRK